MIRILQELSRAGGTKNEDLIWYDAHTALVLDGSTSLLPSALDGSWFVARFSEAFQERLAEGDALPEAVNAALERVRALFFAELASAQPGLYPSAAGVFVREREDTLEALAVGDCTALFRLKNGETLRCTDDAVRRLDDGVLELCRRLRERSGESIAALVKSPEVSARLIRNRKKMNRPGGYRILSFGMPPCTERDLLRIPAGEVARFALYSDGFEAVQEGFSPEDVSLEALYAALRREEAEDPDFNLRPRFKPGDDASALLAVLEQE